MSSSPRKSQTLHEGGGWPPQMADWVLPEKMNFSGRDIEAEEEEAAPLALDTSWLDEPPAARAGVGKRGSKRRTRRRKTLSPSQVTTTVSGVDWVNGDFMTYPDFPCADEGEGAAGGHSSMPGMLSPPLNEAATSGHNSEATGEIWADKTDLACLTNDTPERRLTPPLVLSSLENQRDGETLNSPLEQAEKKKPVDDDSRMEQMNRQRKGVGAPDARVATDAENVQPRATVSSSMGKSSLGTGAEHTVAVVSHYQLGNEEKALRESCDAEEQRRGIKTSRKSRRRSMVMPSEATRLIEDGDNDALDRASAAPMGKPVENVPCPTIGDSSRTGTSAEEKSRKKSSATPPIAINATSCLSHSLVAQRGWKGGPGDDTKTLMRAYYAAPLGSQRARRVAARLFCMTGYCLLPVAPEDARVLCSAAGDSLDWGLEDTDLPQLRSKSRKRTTREQKRELVLRIKPLFDLIEQEAKAEKLAVENATGIVSRKAAPDGYCYEDKETGEAVDPELFKARYMEHAKSVSSVRRGRFVSQRTDSQASALSKVVVETSVDGKDGQAADAGACAVLEIVASHLPLKADTAAGEGDTRQEQITAAATPPSSPPVETGVFSARQTSQGPRSPAEGCSVVEQDGIKMKRNTGVDGGGSNVEGATRLTEQSESVLSCATPSSSTPPAMLAADDGENVEASTPIQDNAVAMEAEVLTRIPENDRSGAVLSPVIDVPETATPRSPINNNDDDDVPVAVVLAPLPPQDSHPAVAVQTPDLVSAEAMARAMNVPPASQESEDSLSAIRGSQRTAPFVDHPPLGTSSAQTVTKPEGSLEIGGEAGQSSGRRLGDRQSPSSGVRGTTIRVAERHNQRNPMVAANTSTPVAPPDGGRDSASGLSAKRIEAAATETLKENPVKPAAVGHVDKEVSSSSLSPSMRGGAIEEATSADGSDDTARYDGCHTPLSPLSVSPISFPVRREELSLSHSRKLGDHARNGGQAKRGFGLERQRQHSSQSPATTTRGASSKFVVPDEYSSVPREEHAALKAEFQAIEERLHATIEAAFQQYHADRALAVARHQHHARQGAIPADATGSSPPRSYSADDRKENLTARASIQGSEITTDKLSVLAQRRENGNMANTAGTEGVAADVGVEPAGRVAHFHPVSDGSLISPPAPQSRASSPMTAESETSFQPRDTRTAVNTTPSSPLVHLPDLRLSEDDLFGSSPNAAVRGVANVQNAGASSSACWNGKMNRRSLSMAFSATSSSGGAGRGARRADAPQPQHREQSRSRGAGGDTVQEQDNTRAKARTVREEGNGDATGLEPREEAIASVCQICYKRPCESMLRPCRLFISER